MSARPSFALLAALWLVVAIATVALALGLEAREQRSIGLAASDRGVARAAAAGGLAIARARLEQVLHQPRTSGSAAELLRASDPWLDADSLFADTIRVGDAQVRVQATDLGTQLNINEAQEAELRRLLNAVLHDDATADALTQAILDWRDPDDLPRPRGAEREQYLAHGLLVLPANGPFRDADELRFVEGMTPEIFARIRPYVTTQGSGRININAAPEPVLRAIPEMTDPIITRILAVRSQGQRIRSVDDLIPVRGGQGTGGAEQALRQRIVNRVTLETAELELTITASAPPPARPVSLQAVVRRAGNQTTMERMQW